MIPLSKSGILVYVGNGHACCVVISMNNLFLHGQVKSHSPKTAINIPWYIILNSQNHTYLQNLNTTIFLKLLLLLPVMVGKHQYFNFFLIFLSLSLLCIQYGMSRPLNTLELKKSIFMKSPHNMGVRNSLVMEGHKQNKNIRRLEIDNSGPSPDGQGH